MNKSIIIVSLGALSACQQHREVKPNIIFILADDMGYGDLGCYGQKIIKTPNIDRMASEGIRFTQFYAGCTVSAPSRCALMTGKHMGHAYVRGNDTISLRGQDTVIAQIMKRAGYTTGMFGKWGLGNNGTSGDPAVKGWDAFTGYTNQVQAHHYYQHSIDKIINGKTVSVAIDSTKYTHEIEMGDAMQFIRDNKDKLFFAYIPIRIPHSEFIVPEKDLKPYLDEKGESIFEEVPYPGGEFKPYDKPYAAYAAMITKLDKEVGELLAMLKELNIDKNTLVFFASDNGAENGYSGKKIEYFQCNGPLRGSKLNLYEGGIRVPMIGWCPGLIPSGVVSDQVAAFWDIPSTFCDLAGIDALPFPDGLSFKNTLMGKKQEKQHDYIYHEYGVPWQLKYIRSIRNGDWKLVVTKRNIKAPVVELFNLKDDISEMNNLAKQHPEKVSDLLSAMDMEHVKPDYSPFDYSYLVEPDEIPSRLLSTADGKPGGLTATYYSGRNFDKLVRTQIDTTMNNVWEYNAPAGLPDDGFSIRWEGSVAVPETATYHFYTAADDGVRLWVNNQLVIDDWKSHGVEMHDGTIKLEKGKKYLIRFEYLEDKGGAEVRIGWLMNK